MNPIELLGKVVEISHSNLELSARVGSILNIISQDMGHEEVLVYTLDKDKRLSCRYKNQKSVLFNVLSQYRCHVGEGIIGSVAQKRTPQYYSSRDIPPRFGCLFYPELDHMLGNYRSFSFLPLADDSYLFGVLVLCAVSRETIRDSEKILLSILSREIGGILRSFELIFSSKKRISELAMLSELGKVLISNLEPYELLKSLALIIAKSLNATFVTIRLDYAPLKLDSQRFTYGLIDPVIKDSVEELEQSATKLLRAVSLKNGSEHHKEPHKYVLYSAPVISKNRTLGTITLCGEQTMQPHTFEEDGQYVINTIANYISSGLENTLLNTRLRDVVRELTDAQKRLIDQEKFHSLGEMTASIAHEIKNPLVIIGGFTKRLAKKMEREPGVSKHEDKYIDIILKEVVRLEAILNEILNFVREDEAMKETCVMNSFLDEILYLLSADSSWEEMTIVRDYDATLPAIPCDSQQLKQVFINILMNAFEAMHGKGTLSVETRRKIYNNQSVAAISITDTGGGIRPEILDNVFNPFFTTKEKGTGLGLAITHKIIANHHGRIDIQNTVGKGVTFVVYLPLNNSKNKEEFL